MSLLDVHPYASHAPAFAVDGRDNGRLARDLLRLDVHDDKLGLRTMVMRLQPVSPDSDGSTTQLSYLDGAEVELGSAIDCVLGPPGLERSIFTGTVSAIEVTFTEGGTPVVSLFAEDALMRLRMTERTATYLDVRDADVLDRIASAHGLGSDSSLSDPVFAVIQQFQQTDLGFLRDRARRRNAEIWLDSDDVIHLDDREVRPGARLQLVQGNELIDVALRADLAHQRSTVEVRGWDDTRVEAVAERAGNDVIAAEVASGRTGPEAVGDVFDEPVAVRGRRDALVSETAMAFAEAELRRRARAFVTVDGTTSGSPDLVCGAHLDLRRVGAPFEGDGYRVVHAHHSYDLSIGHRTHFRAERPAVNR